MPVPIIRRLALPALALVAADATAAPAQPASPPSGPQLSGGFEDIIVTARRREERLQEAPLAISALSGNALEQMNIRTSDNLDARIPNLSLSPSPGGAASTLVAYIRGIGEYAPNFTNDSSVGIYVDGVYHARMSGNLTELNDIERIEVLRGPQGTLFGRNTTGGALNIVTRAPADDPGVIARAGYGSDDELVASASVDTGQLGTSGIAARLSAFHRRRDGFVDNVLTPDKDDPGAIRTTGLSAVVEAEVSPDFTVDYRGDYSRTRSISNVSQIHAASQDVIDYFSRSPSYGGAPFVVSDRYLSRLAQAGTLPATRINGYGNAVTAEYEASPAVALKSITAWRSLRIRENTQLDGNGPLLGEVLGVTGPVRVSPYAPAGLSIRRQNQFSQELQLSGEAADLTYVAGLYYFDEDVSEVAPYFLTFVLPGGTAAVNLQPTTAYTAQAKSYAGFGQASWQPASLDGKLEVTLGARYTHDRRRMDQANSSDGIPQLPRALRKSFNNLSASGSVSYKPVPDTLVFARLASGYKAGGFNPQSANDGYGPMKAVSGEVGIKADTADRLFRFNGTIFYTDYDDLQVTQFVAGSSGTTNETVNAGRAVYKGVELEVMVLPAPGLRFEASVGYVDPEYKTFLYRDPLTDEEIDVADEARFAYVSKTTAHLAAQYQHPIGSALLTARVDYAYKSGRFWNPLDRDSPFNRAIASGADNNLSARLSLADVTIGNGLFEIAAWATNLLNKHVIVGGIDYGSLGFGGVTYNRPRHGGVEIRARF